MAKLGACVRVEFLRLSRRVSHDIFVNDLTPNERKSAKGGIQEIKRDGREHKGGVK